MRTRTMPTSTKRQEKRMIRDDAEWIVCAVVEKHVVLQNLLLPSQPMQYEFFFIIFELNSCELARCFPRYLCEQCNKRSSSLFCDSITIKFERRYSMLPSNQLPVLFQNRPDSIKLLIAFY